MEQIPIEEMDNPVGYNVSLCFEWMDFDSCMTFELVADGEITNKGDLVASLIDSWGGIVEMEEDGTIVNLDQFKMAYVTENPNVEELDITKKPTMKLVH